MKNKEDLFAFYDFPAQCWQHIRTTNPIESTFATARHRTRQTKGFRFQKSDFEYGFSDDERSSKEKWKKLRGYKQIPEVLAGIVFLKMEKERSM